MLAAFFPQIVFSQTPAPSGAPAGAAPDLSAAAAETAPNEAAAGGTPQGGAPGTAASRAQEEALNFFGDPASASGGTSPAGSAGSGAAAGGAAGTSPAAFSPVFAIIRMILVLALVAALVWLAVYLLRRLGKPQTEQNPHLKVLASTHLGNGRYIHVVQAGTAAWLIGSGEGGVSHIADITDQEAVDAMALDASKKSAETPGFVPAFQALLHKFSGGLSGGEQNRLEKMRRRREQFKRF